MLDPNVVSLALCRRLAKVMPPVDAKTCRFWWVYGTGTDSGKWCVRFDESLYGDSGLRGSDVPAFTLGELFAYAQRRKWRLSVWQFWRGTPGASVETDEPLPRYEKLARREADAAAKAILAACKVSGKEKPCEP